ncbi:immunoglobulin superfamily member 2 [Paroedura picta]|uniref:immunoglobulin superfamily member 2 n=1 Tax=Paroedura picta TaxID=143630 RepID=UPI004056F142
MGSTQGLVAELLFLFGLCAGQRMVTVQKGLLYRAEGYHITIWCNVSGYGGPLEQTFRWSVYRPSAPETEMQLISTSDSSFPYAIYAQRVSAEEIYIKRIQGDSILLHITKLQAQDAGEYECHTPNTDERYFGSYSAKTSLSVIPDTLSATMKLQDLTQGEGDSLELICEVSTATVQHTHLSVSWHLVQGDKDRKILSLSRDFVLIAGSSYNQRVSSGDIRLDKIGDKKYKLSIIKILPSDQGEIYCEAVEWIQDPDETWKDIAWKRTNKTSLTVRSFDDNISVNMTVAKSSVLEGEVLQINCSVQGQNIQNRWFQLVWLHHDRVVASISQHGALAFQEDNGHRYTRGNLLVMKQSNEKYILRINQAELKDQGTYRCEVSEIERSSTGSLAVKEKKSSSGTHINVSPRESKLKVSLDTKTMEISMNDATEIKCEIISLSKEESPLGVSWYFQPLSPADAVPLLILATNYSNIVEYGKAFGSPQKKSRFHNEKVSSHLYKLSILPVDYDAHGTYYCVVEEWVWSVDSGWYILGKMESGKTIVNFKPSENELHIESTNHSITITENEDVTLKCCLQSQMHSTSHISISWFKVSVHSSTETLLKIKDNGIIEYGNVTMARRLRPYCPSAGDFHLTIQDVEMGDSGLFYCHVEEWAVNCSTAQVQQASAQSGYSELVVLPPVSTNSTEICSSASVFHFLLFYPLVMFLILMAAILCLCFKIKLAQRKQCSLKTKQEFGAEMRLM